MATNFHRMVVYVPKSMLSEAKKRGMTNYSRFVRRKFEQFIETHDIVEPVEG